MSPPQQPRLALGQDRPMWPKVSISFRPCPRCRENREGSFSEPGLLEGVSHDGLPSQGIYSHRRGCWEAWLDARCEDDWVMIKVDVSIWCSRWTVSWHSVHRHKAARNRCRRRKLEGSLEMVFRQLPSLLFPPHSEFPPPPPCKAQWRGFLKAQIHDLQQRGRQNWKL